MPEKYAVLINVLFKTPVILLLPMIVACIIIGIIFLRKSRREAAIESHVRQHGVTTTGHIIKHRVLQRDYYVTYGYEYDGKVYGNEQKVTSDLFNALRDGDAIEVCYLPEGPDVSQLVIVKGVYLKSLQMRLTAIPFLIMSILLLISIATIIVRWMIWMVHTS